MTRTMMTMCLRTWMSRMRTRRRSTKRIRTNMRKRKTMRMEQG